MTQARSRAGRAAVASTTCVLLLAGALAPAAAAAPQVGPDDAGLSSALREASAGASEAGDRAGRPRSAARTLVSQGATKRVASLRSAHSDVAPSDRQRLTSVQVTQDLLAKRLTATANFRAAPTAAQNASVLVFLGEFSGSSCAAKVGIGASGAAASTDGTFLPGGTPAAAFAVTRRLSGTALTMQSATNARFGTAPWDCAYAAVTSNDGATVYQRFYAEDLVTQYVPRFVLDAGAPVQGSYRGRWTTVDVDVRNAGKVEARNVRLTASGKKLSLKRKTVQIGGIGRGSTRYGVPVKVRLKGTKMRKLTLRVSAAGAPTVSTTVSIAQRPRPKKVKSLVGRYYWGVASGRSDIGWDNRAVRFVSKRWAYTGFPKAGVPTCKAGVKGCTRYSYSARTGKLKLGKQRAAVTTEGFKLRGVRYSPLTVPKKGARIATRLIHQDFRGCGVYAYCTTWTETLAFDRAGRFVRTRSTISSIGVGGTGSIFSSAGPTQRGRYQVLSKGRVRLSYDSGRRHTVTIGIEQDVRGRPSPAGVGLLLGDVNFYRD